MFKIKFPKFLSGGIQTDIDQKQLLLDEYITRTISYPMGYIRNDDEFTFNLSNKQGQMYNTQFIDNPSYNAIEFSRGATALKVLNTNVNRLYFYISNISNIPCRVYFDDNPNVGFQFIIPQYQIFKLGGYKGSVSVSGELGTTIGSIIEFWGV